MSSAAAKVSSSVLAWTEAGRLPDGVIRAGIRRLCRQRLKEIRVTEPEVAAANLDRFVTAMNQAPIALVPELANEQHYEVPPAFFDRVLGVHRKYSCCYWGDGVNGLDQAEARALEITCARAGIEDGMSVLDLGCGWGSLSLWLAENYPRCTVTAVSNSAPQRSHIERLAAERCLHNLRAVTRDMNRFAPEHQPAQPYDRIVSIEMFEHMRNHRKLFQQIAGWLQPDGRFFLHIFCHRLCAYEFRDEGPTDWMGRHFFAGGIMPSDDLPLRFQEHLRLLRHDRWSGEHYQRTANAWLANMDARRAAIMPIMAATYGEQRAEQWFQRWRIFFMACAELFGLDEGREWYIGHYLFEPNEAAGRVST